jgi:hypothetical protein
MNTNVFRHTKDLILDKSIDSNIKIRSGHYVKICQGVEELRCFITDIFIVLTRCSEFRQLLFCLQF